MQAYETATTRLRAEETGACALVQDLLPLYLEGEVSPVSREQISQHLASCERCAGFLAGAQSVRGQLRRHDLQRASSLRADAQPRGAVLRVRELLAGVTAMLLCLPGGAAAAAISAGLDGSSDALFVGMVVAAMVCAGLLALARLLGPLTSARLSAIFGGVALGGAGVILLMVFGSGAGSPLGILAGFAVGIAGLVGVWSGVARDGRGPLVHGA
jgi:anti-sigma factor RsiW